MPGLGQRFENLKQYGDVYEEELDIVFNRVAFTRSGEAKAREFLHVTLAKNRTTSRHGFRKTFNVSSFGKVCTVNTVYFWSSLDADFAEIHRVLSPGGRVVVGFLPKVRMDRMGMPKDIFTSRAPEDVIAALTKAGFSDVRIERPEPTTPWNVLVATR